MLTTAAAGEYEEKVGSEAACTRDADRCPGATADRNYLTPNSKYLLWSVK